MSKVKSGYRQMTQCSWLTRFWRTKCKLFAWKCIIPLRGRIYIMFLCIILWPCVGLNCHPSSLTTCCNRI